MSRPTAYAILTVHCVCMCLRTITLARDDRVPRACVVDLGEMAMELEVPEIKRSLSVNEYQRLRSLSPDPRHLSPQPPVRIMLQDKNYY